MLILGLDIASKTGYAFYDTETNLIIESGIIDLTKRRGESSGVLFLKFRIWLETLIKKLPIDFVAYEQSHHRGGASTEITLNLTGRVQEICSDKNIEYTTVHSSTLKKFATGFGKASKKDMKKAASKIINKKVINDDEADAIHIARWAYEYLKNPKVIISKPKTKRQKIKLTNKKTNKRKKR